MTPDRRELTTALIALLELATDRPWGDGKAPGQSAPEVPYGIVYAIAGGGVDGGFADPHTDATFVYQLSSVGATREQAEWLADRARRAVLGRDPTGALLFPLAAADLLVIYRDADSVGGVERDGGFFTAADRYSFLVEAA